MACDSIDDGSTVAIEASTPTAQSSVSTEPAAPRTTPPEDVDPIARGAAALTLFAVVVAALVVAAAWDVRVTMSALGAVLALGLALHGPTYIAGFSRVLVLCLLVVAAVLLLLVARGGAGALVLGLAWAVQLGGALMLRRAEAAATVVAVAAAVASGLAAADPATAPGPGLLLLAGGWAAVQVVGGLVASRDAQALATVRSSIEATPPVTGKTRVELDRVRHEFSAIRRQLRREASSRQQAEQQLMDALRIKETFLATMNHELRTPLSQIIGYSELLLEEAEPDEGDETAADIGRIHQAAMHLFDIVDNVLSLSRIEAGLATTSAERVELHGFIDQLTRNLAGAVRQQGNTLRVRCRTDIGEICTDRAKLHAILKNLLDNACKFTQGGTIRIAVELDAAAEAATYVFTVSDTGVGIRAEDMERLFRPFEQVDGARTRRHDGTGLGLALSRQLCAMLGGTLTATSTPGAGSTFVVRLPRDAFDAHQQGVLVRSMAGP
jgi:signal transduction histidine kinase